MVYVPVLLTKLWNDMIFVFIKDILKIIINSENNNGLDHDIKFYYNEQWILFIFTFYQNKFLLNRFHQLHFLNHVMLFEKIASDLIESAKQYFNFKMDKNKIMNFNKIRHHLKMMNSIPVIAMLDYPWKIDDLIRCIDSYLTNKVLSVFGTIDGNRSDNILQQYYGVTAQWISLNKNKLRQMHRIKHNDSEYWFNDIKHYLYLMRFLSMDWIYNKTDIAIMHGVR